MFRFTTVLLATAALAAGCGDDGHDHDHDDDHGGGDLAHSLFVATNEGTIVSYDLATAEERAGTITDAGGATDLTALDSGLLVANLSGENEVLFFDAATMLEETRIPSSGAGGLRPVHGYLTPLRAGKQYWIALNDGDGTPESNSAIFVDVVEDSPTYLQAVAEVRLGVGHHKGTVSASAERLVVSNISECDKVLQVFDYSDIASVTEVGSVSAEQLGFEGCDPSVFNVPSPHGCASADATAYCNLTGPGQVVSIDIDAETPEFRVMDAAGAGAGYTLRGNGRYIYSLQTSPREGAGGADCQIGQLLTVDAQSDAMADELALMYDGPGVCDAPLTGSDEEGAGPGHLVTHGDYLFVTPAGRFGNEDDRVRRELVVDISDMSKPVQLASIEIGAGTGHVNDALSGDGKWLFVANGVDGTVSQISIDSLTVTATLQIAGSPRQVATYGTVEGPSHQTGPNQ